MSRLQHSGRKSSLVSLSSSVPLWMWTFAAVSGIWLAGSILFAIALSSTTGILSQYLVPQGVSYGVLILNVLVDGVQIALGLLGSGCLDLVFWALFRHKPGQPFPVMLAISSSTGVLGMMQLLKWKSSQTNLKPWTAIARRRHLFWILLRYSGVVIMALS
jgi:hypothetical protein